MSDDLLTEQSPGFQAALNYLKHDPKVRPITRGEQHLKGKRFKGLDFDLPKLRNHYCKKPEDGVAIVCGSRVGWIVIDCDPRNGGTESLEKLQEQYGPLPETPTVETE